MRFFQRRLPSQSSRRKYCESSAIPSWGTPFGPAHRSAPRTSRSPFGMSSEFSKVTLGEYDQLRTTLPFSSISSVRLSGEIV